MSSNSKQVVSSRQRRKEDLVYIMGGKCQICGYDKCISALEFHHCEPALKEYQLSNGNCHSLESDLQEARKCILLCSNCHREVEYENIKLEPYFDEIKAEEILNLRQPKKNHCENCGKEISAKAKLCVDCFHTERRQSERPDRETLKFLIRTKSFLQIGKDYGVTDNAIRKWCKAENLPSKKTEINKYTDEDWEKI